MQRLGGGDRHQTLLARAAEENGDPHQFVSALSSFRDAPKVQTRNLPWPVRDSPMRNCASEVRLLCKQLGNDDYGEIPIRLISQCSSIPDFSFTRARTASGAATFPRKRAEVKMIDASTPLLR